MDSCFRLWFCVDVFQGPDAVGRMRRTARILAAAGPAAMPAAPTGAAASLSSCGAAGCREAVQVCVMSLRQYGGMHLLRVSGWAVIIAAPAVLIIGVAAAHRASAPPRPARVGGTAPAVNSHPAVADTNAGGRGLGAGTGVAIDPAYFSPGACVAFPPVAGNRHLKVFLDAGHGGLDPGGGGHHQHRAGDQRG